MKFGGLKSFADSKRVKYGTVNIIFIAMIIAIAIVLNSIVTVLSDTFNWRLDMTEEQLYTVSDELVSKLEDVSENIELDIIFGCDKDEAELNFTDLESGNALSYIHSTATQLAEKMDNVSVVYCDPVRDYEFMKKFTTVGTQIKPSESTVTIARRGANGEYGTHYRTYHAQSFYTFAESDGVDSFLYGYNGEMIFATAILSLTYDKIPTVYFTYGHGESLAYKNSSGKTQLPEIIKLFLNSGFEGRYIDLSDEQFTCETKGCGQTYGTIDVDFEQTYFKCISCSKEYRTDELKDKFTEDRQIPSDARMIVINQPDEADFTSDELTKLGNYMVLDKGSVMCFTSYDAELPVLYDFIATQTGVTVNYGDRIIDDKSNMTLDKIDFRGNIASTSAASVYLGSLTDYGSSRPIFYNGATLTIDSKFMNEESEGYDDGSALRYTLPLIQTGATAEFGGRTGKHTVMDHRKSTFDHG